MTLLKTKPGSNDDNFRFTAHYGVWWKIYLDEAYFEDFPYCPCCEPKQKLVQTEWHPDETFKCPKTNTELKLFDAIPWNKREVLERLYKAYFSGQQITDFFNRERNRFKQLNPEATEQNIVRHILALEPFNKIPKDEAEKILQNSKTSYEFISFVRSNYLSYRKYFRNNEVDKD
ncbi:MAG: hypothetical protein ACYC7L_16940 [Nitrospirota bacterium]